MHKVKEMLDDFVGMKSKALYDLMWWILTREKNFKLGEKRILLNLILEQGGRKNEQMHP